MIPKKKEGEIPGPGKAWSSIVGGYQDREMGGKHLRGWVGEEQGVDMSKIQQLAYKIIPMKKEEEGPNPGKAWSSIVGGYQDREKGGGKIGEWMERRGLMGHMGRGEPGKGKAFGM